MSGEELWSQPFGIKFHLQCMSPLICVESEDPQAVMDLIVGKITAGPPRKDYYHAYSIQDGKLNKILPKSSPLIDSGALNRTMKWLCRPLRACPEYDYRIVFIFDVDVWLKADDELKRFIQHRVEDDHVTDILIFLGKPGQHVSEDLAPYVTRIGPPLAGPSLRGRVEKGLTGQDLRDEVVSITGRLRLAPSDEETKTLVETLAGSDAYQVSQAIVQGFVLSRQRGDFVEAVQQGVAATRGVNGWPEVQSE